MTFIDASRPLPGDLRAETPAAPGGLLAALALTALFAALLAFAAPTREAGAGVEDWHGNVAASDSLR